MPTSSPKFGLPLPNNSDFVKRINYNDLFTRLDAATAPDHAWLKSVSYDAGNNRITAVLGPVRARFGSAMVIITGDTTYHIAAPAINTNYTLYLKSDGTFMHNTTGADVAGAVQLWRISSGATLSTIATQDQRGGLFVTPVVTWDAVTGKPSSFTPTGHAGSHAAGGSDPLTPEAIGAVPVAAVGDPNGVASLTGGKLTPAQDPDKVFHVTHEWAIPGEIRMAAGTTDYLLPFQLGTLADGQTVKLKSLICYLQGGTSATIKLARTPWGGAEADLASPYTGIVASTTPQEITGDVALSARDRLRLVVTAVNGAPTNLVVSLTIEHTQ